MLFYWINYVKGVFVLFENFKICFNDFKQFEIQIASYQVSKKYIKKYSIILQI